MTAKLTLTIEDKVISLAKKYAQKKGKKPFTFSRKLLKIN